MAAVHEQAAVVHETLATAYAEHGKRDAAAKEWRHAEREADCAATERAEADYVTQ